MTSISGSSLSTMETISIIVAASLPVLALVAGLAWRLIKSSRKSNSNSDRNSRSVQPSGPQPDDELWWRVNPSKRVVKVSGACYIETRAGAFIVLPSGLTASSCQYQDNVEVHIGSGAATLTFTSPGTLKWTDSLRKKTIEASVACPEGGSVVTIEGSGRVSLDRIDRRQATPAAFIATGCQELSFQDEHFEVEARQCGQVFAGGTIRAFDCGKVYVSKFGRGAAYGCESVSALDDAVVFAADCGQVVVMKRSRVKTRNCREVVQSDPETSTWEKV